MESKSDEISNKYLYYFMKKYVEILRKESIGGVIKYIKLSNINDAKMPIYSISKQNKIIEKISKIEDIIELRREQINKINNLVKSQFVYYDIYLKMEVA